jgi:hypothetical protein
MLLIRIRARCECCYLRRLAISVAAGAVHLPFARTDGVEVGPEVVVIAL